VTAAEIAADGADLPLGRVCTAAEIAAAVVFLASREPRSMTGTTLTVDGGNTAQ
jgi:NAD(P)-dependent dehydrogenase (short-subunit alcohol dehydrogenase family)